MSKKFELQHNHSNATIKSVISNATAHR